MMKPFRLWSQCKKCGYVSAPDRNRFRPPSVKYSIGLWSRESQEVLSDATIGGTSGEFLLRECLQCGFKWPEKVIEGPIKD